MSRHFTFTGKYADDYFHARKTFSVIGQICRRHLESHDWFMLSTDDVYVRVNRLHVFLSRRDPEDKVKRINSGYDYDDVYNACWMSSAPVNHLSDQPSVYICVSQFLSLFLSECLFIWLENCLPVYLSVCIYL